MNTPDLRIRNGIERRSRVRFRFDGRDIEACEGESVAAALWACETLALNPGDYGAKPPARTLFCAMGVCQQCALWIDGRRVEACRTLVSAGLDVRTRLDENVLRAHCHPGKPKETACDLVVLGAGPAGVAAAIEAAALGLRVELLDENPAAGGQVYRIAPGIAPTASDPDRSEGDAMRAQLVTSNVDFRHGHRIWHIERVRDAWRVHALGHDGARTLHAATLIVATGAQERHLPFDGWDRPGVIGLAAATVLLKSQRVLPGRAVVVAGAGPLLLVVAKSIIEGGGRVVAVVDANPWRAWFSNAAALASRPDLVARGIGWMRTLRRQHVSMLYGYALRTVSGDAPALRASLVRVERDGRSRAGVSVELACDAVCCGYGLMPATDVTRLVGASHTYDSDRGGWRVLVDDDQRCDRPFVYAAGDGAGVIGAASAPFQGRIAALAAARDLGRIDERAHRARTAGPKRARDRASRFGAAMTRLGDFGDGAMASIPTGVTMCQCEGLTRAALDNAIDEGCSTINDLKSATRCGMGPCGGRLCEEAAARLIAMRTGRTRAEVGQATGRPPLRPVDLDALAGDFDYDELAIPAPSPL